MTWKDIPRLYRRNLQTLRESPATEIAGALGDLGTLLPLMLALAARGSIDLSSTLVFTGLFNILTGAFFGLPLPVQPMKAIAAASIRQVYSVDFTASAGACVSAAILVLSVTGLLRWLTTRVPEPVVRGIQLGAGLSLILSAGTMLQPLAGYYATFFDNLCWALLVFVLLVATQRLRRFPFALVVFLFGLAIAFVVIIFRLPISHGSYQYSGRLPHLQLWWPSLYTIRIDLWGRQWDLAIAQLPLTTLNSIIATSALAADLLPDIPTPSVTELGFSVAGMNLLSCWFGAMPVCHGAGGLAAQYRFGARSGASIILLGFFKLVLGLAFGSTLSDLLEAYPSSVLGVMVVAAGLELARVGLALLAGDASGELTDKERSERWTICLMTMAGLLVFRSDAMGFLAGMVTYWTYRAADRMERRLERPRALAVEPDDRSPLLS